MKILIIGISGQLGHSLGLLFADKGLHVLGISRKSRESILSAIVDRYGLNSNAHKIFTKIKYLEVQSYHIDEIDDLIAQKAPDVILNCMGVIKQNKKCKIEDFYDLNSLIPIKIAHLMKYKYSNIKLIHFSTDCVFDGKKGDYLDIETPNAIDIYGKSKFIGEIFGSNISTLRTSFIGPEIFTKKSLFEWVLSNKNGQVNGYTNAYWSGLTVLRIGIFLVDTNFELPKKVFHFSLEPKISKFDLLEIINNVFDLGMNINGVLVDKLDRSLVPDNFILKKFDQNLTYYDLIGELKKWINYLQIAE